MDGPTVTQDANVIDASPTKDFFIHILTRDIDLADAILDLIDNCTDGIRRLDQGDDWSAFQIDITGTQESFAISDNCGGIPIDLARDYAFRFGRPEGTEVVKGSVGAWGVGMKRALFKLGGCFSMQSRAPESRFDLTVDVEAWKREREWQFHFEDWDEDSPAVPPDEWSDALGTSIVVSDLHQNVAARFRPPSFWNELRRKVRELHSESLARGLQITINGQALIGDTWTIKQSATLTPMHWRDTMNGSGAAVSVRMYAGVHDSEPREAGWYVFCNGRMVLQADQTDATGWGERDGTRVPRFHGQFSRFRGYVFFDCADPQRLPWNTTKTGIDVGSPVYRRVRQRMVLVLRKVIDFLNLLDAESDQEEKPLTLTVETALTVPIADITRIAEFDCVVSKRTRPEMINVQYPMHRSKVNAARKVLNASSAREVGRKTFEYFFTRECEDR